MSMTRLILGVSLLVLSVNYACLGQLTVDDLVIYTRAQWGARTVPLSAYNPVGTITRVLVGHTAGPNAKDYDGTPKAIKGIQDYHMDTKGWTDGAYHFVIAPRAANGAENTNVAAVYEMRPLTARSIMVKNEDTGSISVAILGNYLEGNDVLSEASKNALKLLAIKLSQQGSIDCSTNFLGASEVSSHAGPGPSVIAFLPEARSFCNDALNPLNPLPLLITAIAAGVVLCATAAALWYRQRNVAGADGKGFKDDGSEAWATSSNYSGYSGSTAVTAGPATPYRSGFTFGSRASAATAASATPYKSGFTAATGATGATGATSASSGSSYA